MEAPVSAAPSSRAVTVSILPPLTSANNVLMAIRSMSPRIQSRSQQPGATNCQYGLSRSKRRAEVHWNLQDTGLLHVKPSDTKKSFQQPCVIRCFVSSPWLLSVVPATHVAASAKLHDGHGYQPGVVEILPKSWSKMSTLGSAAVDSCSTVEIDAMV